MRKREADLRVVAMVEPLKIWKNFSLNILLVTLGVYPWIFSANPRSCETGQLRILPEMRHREDDSGV